MKKMVKRHREILNMLERDGEVYLSEVAELFRVSKETVRKDFQQLIEEHQLVRVHGGIKKQQHEVYKEHYMFSHKQMMLREEKNRLCFQAAQEIEDGDCIYIDSGSTVSFLMNHLHLHKKLTIVTPSIAILNKYMLEGFSQISDEQEHRFIFIGGQIDQEILTTYGSFFESMASFFYFDRMFFSCDALDIDFGGTNSDEVSFSTVRSNLQRARKTYLLVDHSKFGKQAQFLTIAWKELHYIITDKPVDSLWSKRLEEVQVNLIVS